MKKLLLWSSQVFLGPVDGKSGAKQASCKGFDPTQQLCCVFLLLLLLGVFGVFWTPKQYKRATIVEKTKPEYAKHFTYKPIIIFFFFSANFKKKFKVDSRVWF
jgi:hypothetical protein